MDTPLIAGIATAVVVFVLVLWLVLVVRNRRITRQLRLSSERQSRSSAAIMAIMQLPLEKRVRLAAVALSFSNIGIYKMAEAYPTDLETRFKQFASYAVINAREVMFNRIDITDLRLYKADELEQLYVLMANDLEFLRVCIWMSDFLEAYLDFILHDAYEKDHTPLGNYDYMPDRALYNGDLVFYLKQRRGDVLPNDYIRTMEATTFVNS